MLRVSIRGRIRVYADKSLISNVVVISIACGEITCLILTLSLFLMCSCFYGYFGILSIIYLQMGGINMDIVSSCMFSMCDIGQKYNIIVNIPSFFRLPTPASHSSRNGIDTMGKIRLI